MALTYQIRMTFWHTIPNRADILAYTKKADILAYQIIMKFSIHNNCGHTKYGWHSGYVIIMSYQIRMTYTVVMAYQNWMMFRIHGVIGMSFIVLVAYEIRMTFSVSGIQNMEDIQKHSANVYNIF